MLLNWNGEYYAWSWHEQIRKVNLVSTYFALRPSALVAVPVSVWAIIRKDAPRALLAASTSAGWDRRRLIQKELTTPTHLHAALACTARLFRFCPLVRSFWFGACCSGAINEYASESEWLAATRQAHPNSTRDPSDPVSMAWKISHQHGRPVAPPSDRPLG